MYVKQISVFLENSTGTLAELTQLLGEKGIDLIALSIADTEHYYRTAPSPGPGKTVIHSSGFISRSLRLTVRRPD